MSSIDALSPNINKEDSIVVQSSTIKSLAHSMGFFACGIAKAAPVDEVIALKYRQWLEKEKKLQWPIWPTTWRNDLILVSLFQVYVVSYRLPSTMHLLNRYQKGEYQIAAYALGQDYHDLMKTKDERISNKDSRTVSNSSK